MYKLIAHRGNTKSGKENTLPAFLSAIKGTYAGFECDVRETKDGYFILHHDAFIDNALVSNTFYKDIKSKVNLLKDALKIKTDKIIMVEVKDPLINTRKLIKLLNLYENKNIFVMSFHNSIIEKLNIKTRKYKIGVLNYVLNTSFKHFEYDFLCVLNAFLNSTLINK